MKEEKRTNLSEQLSKKPIFHRFSVWLIGDTPLITKSWAAKGKEQMLAKQVGATAPGKEARNPEEDFRGALYELEEGVYGIPAMGVKNCVITAAHKDKGIARTAAQKALWIDADMYQVRPALAGAVCDMPLVRIFGSDPVMREDMVRVGIGQKSTATLAYRPQFTTWALCITGRYNSTVLSPAKLAFLFQEAGMSSGLCEWRIDRGGMFGAFHLATAEEEAVWASFAQDGGNLPGQENYPMAAE